MFLSPRLINFVLHMYKQLISEQRYTISVLVQNKMSRTFIAQVINVSKSTIIRDISRNSNAKGVYNPEAYGVKDSQAQITESRQSVNLHSVAC